MTVSPSRCSVVVLWLFFSCWLAGCGCAGSPGRKADPVAEASSDRQSFWGVELELPAGWSGGENDLGGYEWTDGELALMAGRHRIDPGESLEAFLSERRASLEEGGTLSGVERAEQRIGATSVLTLVGRSASDAGEVEVRVLVLRTKPDEGVSLLLVGDAARAGHIDSIWATIVGSLGMKAE